jgi:hypothetical protein
MIDECKTNTTNPKTFGEFLSGEGSNDPPI